MQLPVDLGGTEAWSEVPIGVEVKQGVVRDMLTARWHATTGNCCRAQGEILGLIVSTLAG